MSGYFAVVPASVLDDPELNAQQKLLYAEISALCNREGYCWARNAYFSSKNGVTNRSVRSWVSKLEARGHIRVEISGPHRRIYIANPAQTTTFKDSIKEANQEAELQHEEENEPVPGRNFPGKAEENFHHNSTVNKKEEECNTIPSKTDATSAYQTPALVRQEAVPALADAKEVGKKVLKTMTAVFPITKDEYPLQAKKARQIADRVCEMAPESPEAAADVVLAAFRDLTEHGDGFWRKQPYTPATLASAGIWSRVVAHIRDTYRIYRGMDEPQGDWENFMEDVW